ncbi:Retrovirus-related Pol polyprotein from transposon 17.6 [Thelohanellus kitauei]|uniref:Retrovirus-related Pol polyprotein from transposon 17.6 n=1 Tax=Thelohanellus kitauei TaxID=669202 RepID=A0A0C2J1S9_THEKT|nr:Retrovirus-related Pol polyprotein from transposon 17.6 [Thelohanellus kitauei]
MVDMFAELIHKNLLIDLNNIVTFGRNYEENLEHLEEVFANLKSANLKVRKEECEFFKSEIKYLGTLLILIKCEPLSNGKLSRTKKDLETFLGLLGFIDVLSKI